MNLPSFDVKFLEAKPENCKRCGKEFLQDTNSKATLNGFCRRKCQKKGIKYKTKIKNKRLNATAEGNFYYTRKWRELRYRVLVYYGAKCMLCNISGQIMHVDHIKPRSKYPELELDFSNLQVLCEDCNLGKSNKDETDFRPQQ